MVAYVFNKILATGVRKGQIPAKTQSARDWFRSEAKSTTASASTVMKEADPTQYKANVTMGNMYLFQYEAKHKKTLPYFDRFPLIFPFKKAKGGFLGLNMHYLPLKQRAILMDALYETASNDKYDARTKLRLSYDVLNNASQFKWFAPTVHYYLGPQVRSRFVHIASTDWDTALFLPLESFEGASKSTVWKDSRRKVG